MWSLGTPVRYLIGIDVGTSSTKSVLMEEAGRVLAVAQEEYSLHAPQPGWAEQDPEVWWRATVRTIHALLRGTEIASERIAGVGFSGQMHGTVLLDRNRRVLRPAVIWADQRSAAQVQWVYDQVGRARLAALTANPMATGFMAPTLLWVKVHEPDVFERMDCVLLPKDYVRWRLTGRLASDVSDAASSLLFDVAHRRWSAELLDRMGLPQRMLPEVLESETVAGRLTARASEETGLKVGTPVVAGGGDQPVAAIGNGVIEPGTLLVTIGTGGQVFTPLSAPRHDPQLRTHTFCHAVPERWFIMGAMLSAGLSLRWFRDQVAQRPYGELSEQAARIPAGSEGLLFLPYLVGERTPHMDPYARGAFLGLTLRHGVAHMARAIMEGVAFALRDALEIFGELGIEVDRVIASGGGARSSVWRQILADVFNVPIVATTVEEQAAVGAALLAGVGVGVYGGYAEACGRVVRYGDEIFPRPDHVDRYAQLYEVFTGLYPKLKEDLRAMGI